MKNILNAVVMIGLVTFLAPKALAENPTAQLQAIIEVKADESPKELYHIGVQVDEQNNVKNFYFQDDESKGDEKQTVDLYPLEGLKTGLVILKRKGYDVIKMKTDYNEVKKTSEVFFTYLTNALFHKTRTVSVLVRFNEQAQRYEFVDKNDGHVVTNAFIVSKALGISRIEFH